ncbi:hypothetical protein LOTGIDRAFT_230450 [Lottia gigantea]|uniref:Uncharacterized protein n=1 Tax=Lottia gigantea TaxID=225164 RepID=V4AG26_LOTGI|nr:hypothetical protein LOTGIDRAFT_230450 [Lottia gigantea]ESP02994.1 hypothetical protein LOTGIDRAFT_230450 [Lottia gigantea]
MTEGSDSMKKGSRFRCNYYRISSIVVMSFLVLFMYWAMFSSSSATDVESANGLQSRNLISNNRDKFSERLFNRLDQDERLRKLKNNLPTFDKDVTSFQSRPKSMNDLNIDNTDIRQDIPSNKEQVQDSTNRDQDSNNRFKNGNLMEKKVLFDTPHTSRENQQPKLDNPQEHGDSPAVNSWNPQSQTQNNAQSTNSKSDKWIVLTTIQYPTEDVKFLAQLEDWNIVVAGDTKTPPDWQFGNIHYLSVDKQNALGFETVKLLKTKAYSRKNAAYLYALQHGAKILYETDDDNRPLDHLKNFIYEAKTTGLKFVGQNFFNPYRHFGQPTLWPRGYPLGFVGNENYTDNYRLGLYKTPSVQQGVVNGDPDMGAMFRLTRKTTTEMLNVSFDGEAPPVIVPPGVLAPYNSQNTFFLYDALWSLVIPQTVTFRVCDIWRGYWAQRLLWEIGASVGFFGPNAFQKRNSHSYVVDAIDEEYLYFKTHDLFDALLAWKCDESYSFFKCVISLTEHMRDKEFWKNGDVDLIKAWIVDLQKIGYKEPQRVPFTMLQQGSIQQSNTDETKLTFTAREMFPPMYYKSKYIVTSYWSHVERVLKTCHPLRFPIADRSVQQPVHSDIVLIVVFKTSNYEIIPKLNTLYGSKFPHIAYCGSDFSEYQRRSKSFSEPITFVEAKIESGFFSYRCISQVMKMKYRLNGFLMIGSDTLINPWIFDTMTDRKKLWFDHSKLLRPVSRQADQMPSWDGWVSEFGKTAVNKAWLDLSEKIKSDSLLAETFQKEFIRNLHDNTKMEDGVFVGPSDVIYIPNTVSEKAIRYLDIFSQHNVLHEIVIPTLISGLDLKDNMIPLNGKYLWKTTEKDNFHLSFDQTLTFLHPVEIGKSMNTQQGLTFFCNTYLPLVIGGKRPQQFRQEPNQFRQQQLA